MQGHTMNESDRELSVMVQELWDNDVNRLKPGKDYRISLQVAQHFGCDWRGGIKLSDGSIFRISLQALQLQDTLCHIPTKDLLRDF